MIKIIESCDKCGKSESTAGEYVDEGSLALVVHSTLVPHMGRPIRRRLNYNCDVHMSLCNECNGKLCKLLDNASAEALKKFNGGEDV